jgi:hypothetical protein
MEQKSYCFYILLCCPSEDSLQGSAIPDGSPSKDWQSTVGRRDCWIQTQDWSFTSWCRYQWTTTAPWGETVAVRYHVDWWTKNKCMYWIPTQDLFLTCTESPFCIKHTQIHSKTTSCAHVIYKKRNTLIWKDSPFFMLAFPQQDIIYIQTTLPRSLLLVRHSSTTKRDLWKLVRIYLWTH